MVDFTSRYFFHKRLMRLPSLLPRGDKSRVKNANPPANRTTINVSIAIPASWSHSETRSTTQWRRLKTNRRHWMLQQRGYRVTGKTIFAAKERKRGNAKVRGC